MSIITLTDRITVSVRAKNETQGNSQKRDTGRNIDKALGNNNISDSLADQLGNTKNPTITDENGNEWVSMNDFINAGRIMKENGAFKTKEVHDGMTDSDGTVYGAGMTTYPVPILGENKNGNKVGVDGGGGQCCFYGPDFYGYYGVCIFSTENTWYHIYRGGAGVFDDVLNSESATIAGVTYSFFRENVSDANLTKEVIEALGVTASETYPSVKDVAAYLFGSTHDESNSLIDWDAPNAEVERQIKELHETLDVSDHPGASGQGIGAGTYILAGPIEFNDGD